ncbi:MAG: geranylgeranyl reductase family protein [Promethearchaeota archaeon]
MDSDILNYDVIIIGGGPAGSTAGFLLSKLGFKVIIIDKERFPRPKLCGGLLSLKTLDLNYKLFNESISSLYRKEIINYLSDHHEIYYKFERYITRNKSPFPFFFVDRLVYDNFLLQKAKDAGATVLEGTIIKKVDIDSCKVILKDDKILRSKFLIGADGANSIVRQEYLKKGLIKEEYLRRYMATGIEAHISRSDLKRDIFDHPILILGIINWGYAWIFPNKDRLVVGLGALNQKNKGNFIKVLKDILSTIKINPNAKIKIKGHPVPYGNFIYNPVYNKVILIGDAGCYVDPMYGEGLYFAQKTAECASLTIQKCFNRSEMIKPYYIQQLNKYIFPLLKNFIRLRWLCYNSLNVGLKFYPIQLLIRLFEKKFLEIINGVRPFRLWKKELNTRDVLLRK